MHSCGKGTFATKSIVSRLRELSRRFHRVSVRETLASDEGLVVVSGGVAGPEPKPRPADGVQLDEPPLPPACDRLRLGDIKVFAKFPTCAGAFTSDVWDGFLDGDRVVIKSYRLYSTFDPTQARIVRLRWYIRVLRLLTLPLQ